VIEGIELSMACKGKVGAITLNLMGSFTYTKPYINDNTYVYTLDNNGNQLNYLNTSLDPSGTLKYRYERMAKLDATVGYKRCTLGVGINHQSAIKNIDGVFNDAIFDTLLGTEQAWNRLNKPTTITDMRFGFNVTADSQIALNIDNIFNIEQLQRPASLGAPRTYSLLYKHSF
jgi:outer membrane receptor for ferric coprogen and ferric-rhodotorulic acid